MHATLSQALPASSRHPRTPLRTRVGPAIVSLLLTIGLTAAGCNRVGTDRDSEVQSATADASTGGDSSANVDPAADFFWPENSDHPRLQIEVDDGDARGTIQIELMPELAPLTVLRVVDLAKNGFYDGTTFHRVIEGFMIQGGDPNSRDRDPNNDGYGGSEIRMDDEFSAAPFERGVVGMANTGRPNTSDGQIFIMHADRRELDGRYTVIGRVVSGMDVVDAITQVEIDRVGRWGPKDRPIENVVMNRVRIASPLAAASPGPQGTQGEGSIE